MVAIGVRDEDLSEALPTYQLHDLLHPLRIELVEDVVQQKQRSGPTASPAQEIELSQLQGNEERLALSLTAFPSHKVSALQHLEVILVDAMQGIAHGPVLEAVLRQLLQQRTSLQLRHIAKLHLLPLLRNLVVELLEDGDELRDELAPLLEDILTLPGHLLLEDKEHLRVNLLILLQHHIPLLQSPVVAEQSLRISSVVLTDHHVDEASPLIAAATDENLIRRRDHDQRNQPDMLRDASVSLLAPSHHLLLPHLQSDVNVLLRPILVLVEALQRHELLPMPDAQHIDAAAVAAAETQEMDGIQHIRLALAVVTDEAIQVRREMQLSLRNVLIIKYGKVRQSHFDHKFSAFLANDKGKTSFSYFISERSMKIVKSEK